MYFFVHIYMLRYVNYPIQAIIYEKVTFSGQKLNII